MLKQSINGVTKSVNVNGGADDIATLMDLMAGEVTNYELKQQGGTEAELPADLNKKVYIVGVKATSTTGRFSSMVSFPHLKVASSALNEVSPDIIGKFNPSYDSDLKCDYVTLKFDKKNA